MPAVITVNVHTNMSHQMNENRQPYENRLKFKKKKM